MKGDVNNFMDLERTLHKKFFSNSYGRGPEAHFEQDETLCGCFWGW